MKTEKRLSVSLVQEKQIKEKGSSMNNIKDREKHDDCEMSEEYDFMSQKRYLFH